MASRRHSVGRSVGRSCLFGGRGRGRGVHKPIISVLVCFLDFVHDFIGDVFHGLCGVRRDDIEGLLVSSHVFVFFDDFLDFRCHLCGRHIFVVEVVITRRWFEIGGG